MAEFNVVMTSDEFGEMNMNGWCTGKAHDTVDDLVTALDALRENADERSAEARNHIAMALYDALKVLAFACGARWHHEDRGVIVERGRKGWDEIAAKYGLREGEARFAEHRQAIFEHLREQILFLLQGPRSNRQQIYDRLGQPVKGERTEVTHLRDLTEKVTQNEMSWEDYVRSAREMLGTMRGAE
jgi:hypothetical protein